MIKYRLNTTYNNEGYFNLFFKIKTKVHFNTILKKGTMRSLKLHSF